MDSYYEAALRAIKRCFSDTSVPVEETRCNMQALKDEIDILIDSLPDDEIE